MQIFEIGCRDIEPKKNTEAGEQLQQITFIGREVYNFLHPDIFEALVEPALPAANEELSEKRTDVLKVAKLIVVAYNAVTTPLLDDSPANRATKAKAVETAFCDFQVQLIRVFGGQSMGPYIHTGSGHLGPMTLQHGNLNVAQGQGQENKMKQHKSLTRNATNHRLFGGKQKVGREK
jgi:hypothetical protein